MLLHFLVVLAVVWHALGCGAEEEIHMVLQATDQIVSYELPPYADPFTMCVRYHGGKLYLYESHSNQILVYDHGSQALVRTIDLNRDPPDEVGKISGFSVLSADTLLVDLLQERKMALIDTRGHVQRYISLERADSGSVLFNGLSLYSSKGVDVFLEGQMLVMIQTPYTLVHLPGKVEREDLARFRMFYLYDLARDRGRFSAFGLPKNYFERGKVRAGFSVIRMADKYVYACMLDSDLFWTRDFETFHTVAHTSKYMPERIATYNPSDPDPYAYLARTSEYTGFYFDRWRGVAYRLGRLAVSPELLEQTGNDYKQVVLHPPNWIVQVFDEELRMLCEQRFTGHRYSPLMAFVAPEGLYVSISNPLRADYSEDSLRFELFELSVAE